MRENWFIGRRHVEATHRLKVDGKNCYSGRPFHPAGTQVHLDGSRKERDGHWTCVIVSRRKGLSGDYYSIVNFTDLERL